MDKYNKIEKIYLIGFYFMIVFNLVFANKHKNTIKMEKGTNLQRFTQKVFVINVNNMFVVFFKKVDSNCSDTEYDLSYDPKLNTNEYNFKTAQCLVIERDVTNQNITSISDLTKNITGLHIKKSLLFLKKDNVIRIDGFGSNSDIDIFSVKNLSFYRNDEMINDKNTIDELFSHLNTNPKENYLSLNKIPYLMIYEIKFKKQVWSIKSAIFKRKRHFYRVDHIETNCPSEVKTIFHKCNFSNEKDCRKFKSIKMMELSKKKKEKIMSFFDDLQYDMTYNEERKEKIKEKEEKEAQKKINELNKKKERLLEKKKRKKEKKAKEKEILRKAEIAWKAKQDEIFLFKEEIKKRTAFERAAARHQATCIDQMYNSKTARKNRKNQEAKERLKKEEKRREEERRRKEKEDFFKRFDEQKKREALFSDVYMGRYKGPNPYYVLGIKQSEYKTVGNKSILFSFKKLCPKWHPDKYHDLLNTNPSLYQKKTRIFQMITDAKNVLLSPEKEEIDCFLEFNVERWSSFNRENFELFSSMTN